MAYTYDQFWKAAQESGLYDEFSDADKELSKRFPDYGMATLSNKQTYRDAGTDAQKLLANQQQEQMRMSYGNFMGGPDGSQYILGGYYNGAALDAMQNMQNSFGGGYSWTGTAPTFNFSESQPGYNNRYETTQQQLLNDVLNRPDFSWSKEADPLWGTYKKEYLREGDRATQNALGQAAATTGGMASSYATTAAAQAGNYYAAQAADMLPTLYQQAFNRYIQDLQNKRDDLSMVNTQEQLDYNKFLNDLSQYNTNRNFALNMYQTDLGQYNADRNYGLQEYTTNFDIQNAIYSNLANAAQQERENNSAAAQQSWNNAYNLLNLMGTANQGMAATLGLEQGQQTLDAMNSNFSNQLAMNKYLDSIGAGGGSGGSGGSSGSGASSYDGGDTGAGNAGGGMSETQLQQIADWWYNNPNQSMQLIKQPDFNLEQYLKQIYPEMSHNDFEKVKEKLNGKQSDFMSSIKRS